MSQNELTKNEYMGFDEAFIPSLPDSTVHAPALIELNNGDLFCVCFSGSFEGNTDICIAGSRFSKENNIWLPLRQLTFDNMHSEQNPSLVRFQDDAIGLVYTSQDARKEGKENMQFTAVIKMQISLDECLTWDTSRIVISEKGTFCRQGIKILSSGRWILGVWNCFDDNTSNASDYSGVYISDDNGLSWRFSEIPSSRGKVHANIIELGNGKLLSFFRSRQADFIYKSVSYDYGTTWSPVKATSLPNNNSSISAVLLKSGSIAIAYNHSSCPDPANPSASVWPGLRCPVAVALSEDEGETWPYIRIIEPGEGYIGRYNRVNNSQYEYPFILQDSNDMLNIVFAYKNRKCIKHIRLSERDIVGSVITEFKTYNPTSTKV